MNTLGMTHGSCNVCRKVVPAKIVTDGQDVYFVKFCREHGESKHFVRSDLADYLRSLRYVKPAWVPKKTAGDGQAACPSGCGFCDRHEQHLCMPIVEITSRCDLTCPACLVDAHGKWDMTRQEFNTMLDRLIETEGQIDVLNLSGGEPLLHPELLSLIDDAIARREIVRVSISTNGLALLRVDGLLESLQDRNVVISLQFDGFDDRIYRVLRGCDLLHEKRAILERLAKTAISTSLTMTVAGGVNDDQFPQLLDYFFLQPHVVSMMIQPFVFAGRGATLTDQVRRLTIPDVIRLLADAGDTRIRAEDFAPLPCSHPLCFNLAYYLMLNSGGTVSLNRLMDARSMMDCLANRTIFGLDAEEHQRMKDLVYELWSGPAGSAPDSEAVLKTLRKVLDEMTCSCFDPRQAFRIAERRIKSIFIHAFQDPDSFDLARARRCCNAYPQTDGRLLPVCVRNVLQNSNGTSLGE